MSEEPDDFQSALVTTAACWLAGNRLRYFLAAILNLRGNLRCAVWKLLEEALDKLSLLTASHHYRFHDDFQSSQLCPRWSNICADCQSSLIVPMMTSSHHYCSHNDFQSSLLFPWWLPVITILSTLEQHICADCQSSLLIPWWLPVITTNVLGGIPCEEPISVQWLAVTRYSHSCWLEVIGLLAHVRIKMSRPVDPRTLCPKYKVHVLCLCHVWCYNSWTVSSDGGN